MSHRLPGPKDLPPGTSTDAIAKRFGPDEGKCPQCGHWLAVERIKGEDGWTSNTLVCSECNFVADE